MVNDTQEVTEGFITEGEDVVVYSAPLFHQFGQTMFFAIGLCRGNPTVLMPTPDVDATLDAIEQYKGTLFLECRLYRMIWRTIASIGDPSSLRTAGRRGRSAVRSTIGGRSTLVCHHQVYQATGVVYLPESLDSEPVPGTIGRPILAGHQLVDPEGTDEVAGRTGELLVHSDTCRRILEQAAGDCGIVRGDRRPGVVSHEGLLQAR